MAWEKIEKIENEKVFEKILSIIARKGKVFRPYNYIWEMLPYSLKVKEIHIPESPSPEEISPVLVASFLEHGQILPVMVDTQGRVIDGRTRAVFFGTETKYLVLPGINDRMLIEIRATEKLRIPDPLARLAEEVGVRLWKERV